MTMMSHHNQPPTKTLRKMLQGLTERQIRRAEPWHRKVGRGLQTGCKHLMDQLLQPTIQ